MFMCVCSHFGSSRFGLFSMATAQHFWSMPAGRGCQLPGTAASRACPKVLGGLQGRMPQMTTTPRQSATKFGRGVVSESEGESPNQ